MPNNRAANEGPPRPCRQFEREMLVATKKARDWRAQRSSKPQRLIAAGIDFFRRGAMSLRRTIAGPAAGERIRRCPEGQISPKSCWRGAGESPNGCARGSWLRLIVPGPPNVPASRGMINQHGRGGEVGLSSRHPCRGTTGAMVIGNALANRIRRYPSPFHGYRTNTARGFIREKPSAPVGAVRRIRPGTGGGRRRGRSTVLWLVRHAPSAAAQPPEMSRTPIGQCSTRSNPRPGRSGTL